MLMGVMEARSRKVGREERPRAVVDGDERCAIGRHGEAIESRVLPLLAGPGELEGLVVGAPSISEERLELLLTHDDDLADELHPGKLVEAVQRDFPPADLDVLLGDLRAHALADPPREQDHAHRAGG